LPELSTTSAAVDLPPAIGSTVGFQAEIVPSSVSKMKVAGAVTAPAVIVKTVVGFAAAISRRPVAAAEIKR
jgi:hypothetical protein